MEVIHKVSFNTGLDEKMFPEFWAECKCGWAYCGETRADAQKAWDDHIDSIFMRWVADNGTN